MKHSLKLFRVAGAIAVLVLAVGCATTSTTHTDLLSAAGFKVDHGGHTEKTRTAKIVAGRPALVDHVEKEALLCAARRG